MLSNNELKTITGGAVKWGIIAIIGAAVSFIAGILDGYFRPLKCN